MRDLFLLDPAVVFLNHGSFGACPASVFEVYQQWQRELERQPVAFLGRRADALLDTARARLAAYLNAAPENLVFVVNATVALNMVARSLPLQPGDEILSTDHEYGAVDKTWQFVCQKTGARLVSRAMPLPVTSHAVFADAFWEAVTPRTRVISISQITSPTALIFPVAEICRRARQAGILTVIDGAHAPGQVPLDLRALGADFYAGNCHKWLCAPKGAGFLYARAEQHALVEPLIVSHGWQAEGTFVSRNQWQGTRDLAAFLSVPAAIDFQQQHGWDAVRARCHQMARDLRTRLAALTGLEPVAPDNGEWFAQMFAAPLPCCDLAALGASLYARYRVEVPLIARPEGAYVRVSLQGYNTQADADALVQALSELLAH